MDRHTARTFQSNPVNYRCNFQLRPCEIPILENLLSRSHFGYLAHTRTVGRRKHDELMVWSQAEEIVSSQTTKSLKGTVFVSGGERKKSKDACECVKVCGHECNAIMTYITVKENCSARGRIMLREIYEHCVCENVYVWIIFVSEVKVNNFARL